MRRVMPPTFFYLAIGLMALLRWLLPLWVFAPWPWNLLGLVPLIGGTWLAVAGSAAFQRAGTTVRPFSASTALVTGGLYRYSRNPMYLGMVIGLLGVGVLLGAVSPFLMVPAFAALLHWRFIAVEERMLTERFGAAYSDYQRRVRRWL